MAMGAPIIESGDSSGRLLEEVGIKTPGLVSISANNTNMEPRIAVVGIT